MEHKLKQFSAATSEEKTGHKLHEQKLPSGNCYKFTLKYDQIIHNITRLITTLHDKLFDEVRLRLNVSLSLILSHHTQKKKEGKVK